jgi:hypothetical protein
MVKVAAVGALLPQQQRDPGCADQATHDGMSQFCVRRARISAGRLRDTSDIADIDRRGFRHHASGGRKLGRARHHQEGDLSGAGCRELRRPEPLRKRSRLEQVRPNWKNLDIPGKDGLPMKEPPHPALAQGKVRHVIDSGY